MTDSIKAETINALSWSFLESIVSRSIQFVIGVILARLLLPEQFGLIGMLLIFIAVAQTFIQSGFSAALIQKSRVTTYDICSIFYFNILVGIVAAGLLCLAAPWIAVFYNQPDLTPLMRVLSLTIVVGSFGTVQGTLFIKKINFKAHTITSLVSGLLSGAVGITLAIEGFGVWSLAFQQVSNSLIGTICLWVLSPWRPSLIFRFKSLRQMFGFGSRLLLSGLIDQVFENIYYVVIGKLFSASDLGFFTRANSLQSLPSLTLSNIVGRVTFPVFSKCQDDPARLKRGLKKALTALALVNFPAMVGLAVTARPLVLVLLGQKWAECIPFLQLLCAVGLLYPLQVVNLNVLVGTGRSDLFLRLEIIKKILTIVNIVITWRWGITAIIYGMIACSLIAYYLNTYYVRILIRYSLLEQLRDIIPYLAAAAATGIGASCIGLLRFPNYFLMLSTQVIAGIVIYVSLCWAFRMGAFVEARSELCNRIRLLRGGSLTG